MHTTQYREPDSRPTRFWKVLSVSRIFVWYYPSAIYIYMTPKIYEIYNLQQKTVVENAYKLAYSLVFKDNDMIWSTNSDVDPSAILRGGACSRPEGPKARKRGGIFGKGQPARSLTS